MLDVLNWARLRAETSGILARCGLREKAYVLATVHRSENTDDVVRLSHILHALNSLDEPVVFPVHPRARAAMDIAGLGQSTVELLAAAGLVEDVSDLYQLKPEQLIELEGFAAKSARAGISYE